MISMLTDETLLTDLTSLSLQLLVPCEIIDKGIVVMTISRFGDRLTQMVIIPPNTVIEDHTHPDVHSVIQPVFGKATIRKDGQTLIIDGWQHPRSYDIHAGVAHGITTYEDRFVFINKQQWLNGLKPSSIQNNLKGRI